MFYADHCSKRGEIIKTFANSCWEFGYKIIYIKLFPIFTNFELKCVGFSLAFSQLPKSFVMFTLIKVAASEHRLYHQSRLFLWKFLIRHGNPAWRKKHFNCIVCSNSNINVELSAVGISQPIAKKPFKCCHVFLCDNRSGRTVFFRRVNVF